MDMIMIIILDFIVFLFIFIAFIILLCGWKQKFSANTKVFLNLLLILFVINFIKNIFPIYIIGETISPFLIYYEIFGSFLWFFFFYALIQEIIKKDLKKNEEKAIQAYNLVEFYKDLFTHDMNKILQNISLSAELSSLYVKDPNKFGELEKLLRLSKEQVNRGANLILNIRKLSKLEKTPITTQPIETIAVLKEAIEYILKSFQDREIYIEIDNPYEEVLVQGNELLTDVIENILNNAVKYNDNSVVDISIRVSKIKKEGLKYLKLEFIDNGMGISHEKKKLIFQKADKIDITSGGMGIGLSLVRKIIESYKGDIWEEDKVQDDYTKGSNFVVLIPLAE